jgi:PPOX class probable F420-dependent enzyme
MRRGLTVDDLGDLVELRLLAVLATYRHDGTVLLSPVWHEWREGGFNVVTDTRGVKARHLRRDPRESIAVCAHRPPYRGVELRCSARLVTSGIEAAVRRVAGRYLGREAGAECAERADDDLLIRLELGDLRAWDFADELA